MKIKKIFLIAGKLTRKVCQSAAKPRILQAQREVPRNVQRLKYIKTLFNKYMDV